MPVNWCIGKSKNSWMVRNTYYEYFADCFIPWLDENNIEKPVIVFLDGHTSHDSLQLSTLCSENGIELLPFSAHATNFMQPCHLEIFWPLKVE